MTILLAESFDHYDSALAFGKWHASTTFGAEDGIKAGAGRWGPGGGGGSGFRTTFADIFLRHDLAAPVSTLIIGCAVNMTLRSERHPFLRTADGTTSQVEIHVDATGEIIVTRGSTIIHQSGYIYPLHEYRYVEVKIVIHDSAGSVQMWVDGVSKFNATGLDTQNTANAQITAFFLGNGTGSGFGIARHIDYDDVVLLDTGGSAPQNDRLGDIKVHPLAVTGNGATNDFTASSGTNASCVDEANPNDDSDFVESSTVGHIDLYALADLPPSVTTIFGVQWLARMRKTDAGVRQIDPAYRVGGTNYFGAVQTLAGAYAAHREIKQLSPATSAAWTTSEINALQIGGRVAA